MLDRVDVHCIWISQAVLDLLPNPLPEAPEGGEIITDPGPGVFCDNAIEMVYKHWPRPDKEKKMEFVGKAMKELNKVFFRVCSPLQPDAYIKKKVGLVGMHDAGVVPHDLRLYQELAGKPEWSMRVYAMLECEKRNTFCPDQAVRVNESMLVVNSVKLFAGRFFIISPPQI